MATNYWFTADLHFDHPFIARERGFKSTSHHDNAIIEGWNKVVQRGDHVIVCGDVFWTSFQHILDIWKLLNGSKIVVKGNHDHWLEQRPVKYKQIYEHKYKWKGGGKIHVVACHYPMLSWNKRAHGSFMVHGHSHGKILPDWHRMDVGVDVAHLMFSEWRPFNLEEIVYLTR